MIAQKLNVVGVRQFNDSIEGKSYDFTKLRVLMPVPADSKNEKGLNVVELRCGNSSEADKFVGASFPCVVEAEVTLTSKGYEVGNVKLAVTQKQ